MYGYMSMWSLCIKGNIFDYVSSLIRWLHYFPENRKISQNHHPHPTTPYHQFFFWTALNNLKTYSACSQMWTITAWHRVQITPTPAITLKLELCPWWRLEIALAFVTCTWTVVGKEWEGGQGILVASWRQIWTSLTWEWSVLNWSEVTGHSSTWKTQWTNVFGRRRLVKLN